MKNRHLINLEGFGSFLEKLSEQSEQVYWLSSPDFSKIQYLSPAYEKIWERSREELYQKPEKWITFLHPDDVKKNYHPIDAMRVRVENQGEDARYNEQYRIITPNGQVKWILDRGFPIFNELGKCCGVTGVAIDITKEKAIETELRRAKELAEASNQMKSDFIRNMEHDIRTPISGIWGLAESLAEEGSNAEIKEDLLDIADCAQELMELHNKIIEFASHGNQVTNNAVFSLDLILEKLIKLEMVTARYKNLSLTLEKDKKIPDMLKGDEDKLYRILINLVSNALKFTNQGHVAVSIKPVYEQESKPNQILIAFTVNDTGIGISEANINRIFDQFVRCNPSNQGIYRGQGLGLNIVKTLVNELNGTIHVESTLGIGSTFTVIIPLETVPTASHC